MPKISSVLAASRPTYIATEINYSEKLRMSVYTIALG